MILTKKTRNFQENPVQLVFNMNGMSPGEALMMRFPKEFADLYKIEKGRDLTLRAEDESKFGVTVR